MIFTLVLTANAWDSLVVVVVVVVVVDLIVAVVETVVDVSVVLVLVIVVVVAAVLIAVPAQHLSPKVGHTTLSKKPPLHSN